VDPRPWRPDQLGAYLLRNTGLTPPTAEAPAGDIQWIAQDQTVPNPTTAALIQSVVGDRAPAESSSTRRAPLLGQPVSEQRKRRQQPRLLLGTAGAATAQQAQGQIATFVAGGAPF
jgi:hypothetical protein